MSHQDLLTGGKNTFAIDVDTFYQYWMPCQKDTVHSGAVDSYKEKILSSAKIQAPVLQGIESKESGEFCIRTLDGRHRIAAAKAAGISTIYVRMSDDLISKIEALFPGVILKNNLQKKNDFMEDDVGDEEDSYEEDLKFYQEFVENQKKMAIEIAVKNFSSFGNHTLFAAASINGATRPAERPAVIVIATTAV